jgi:hypothetical protein
MERRERKIEREGERGREIGDKLDVLQFVFAVR